MEFMCIAVLKFPGALPVEPGHYMTSSLSCQNVFHLLIFTKGQRSLSPRCFYLISPWLTALVPSHLPHLLNLEAFPSFPSSCDSSDQGNDRIGFSHYLFPRSSCKALILLRPGWSIRFLQDLFY